MTVQTAEDIGRRIRQKIVEIVARLGEDASELRDDENIPASGYIDSAGLLELLAWYEDAFKLTLRQEDITVDNLGTVQSMAAFALKRA